jgi:hypothetical protein
MNVLAVLLGPFGVGSSSAGGGGKKAPPGNPAQAAQDAKDAATADAAITAIIATAVAGLSAPSLGIGAAVVAPSGAAVDALWRSQPTHQKAQVWRGEIQ